MESKVEEADQTPPEAEEEPPSASFYHVEIERQGLAGLGLQLEAMQDEYCLVIGIKEGLIEHWNAQQETPEMQVRPWDRLVEVNGTRAPGRQLVSKACAFGQLRLTFERPRSFEVRTRKTHTWGLDITVGDGCLRVVAIKEGPIQEWNQDNPDHAIQCGDRIVAVSPVEEEAPKALDLLQTLQHHPGEVTLRIMSWSKEDE